jgi:hypothetical protein
VISAQEKGLLLGRSWERLAHPRPNLRLEVIGPGGSLQSFLMGPHAPPLRPEDVEVLHRLWVELTADSSLRALHHHQIITVALRRLAADLRSRAPEQREAIIAELRRLAGSGRQ